MPLLPFEKLELVSALRPDEAIAKLAESVEPKKWFRWFGRSRCPFEGQIVGSTFDINRIIGYRNSFLPMIRGTVSPHPAGSQIGIRMALHPSVLVFACVWVGIAILASVAILVSMLTESDQGFEAVLGPPVVLLIVWGFASGSFSFESRTATVLLIEIFRASKVERL
jgi:hypothetical protein